MTIGQRLRELRGIKTLSEFSEKLGAKAANISNIENERSGLSVELAIKITEVCQVSLDWLLTGEEKTSLRHKPEPGYVTIPKDELLELYKQLCQKQEIKIHQLEKELKTVSGRKIKLSYHYSKRIH